MVGGDLCATTGSLAVAADSRLLRSLHIVRNICGVVGCSRARARAAAARCDSCFWAGDPGLISKAASTIKRFAEWRS